MKNLAFGFAAALVSVVFVATEADAARMGGGRSLGAQRNVTSAPPAAVPAKPAQQAAPAAAGFDVQPAPVAASGIPAGFDVSGFLRGAKLNYMKLQIANDQGNLDELREFTTDELFEELKKDVAARGGAKQQTDVMALNADLLEVVTEADRHWASVRFSGTLRESPGDAPQGFEEVWNLAKPVSGAGGWQLAGIQQMH
jgi:predicted lipid-binding transport protein (Tim44 family)